MIKLERTDVFNFEGAIRGMRNPMNSREKSDSGLKIMNETDVEFGYEPNYEYIIGEEDLKLMRKLALAGSDHRKFLRQIMVSVDITAPRYWWAEFDTYKVGTVANSCSTMHTIHKRDLTLDDFSTEHLRVAAKNVLKATIEAINIERAAFVGIDNPELKGDKQCWYSMIQLLPSSYNQMRTVTLNYEVLLNQYHARKAHKLDEWHTYCDWVESLPYFKEICLENKENT